MTRGEKVIRFIEQFCLVPQGKHVGKPIVLERFQKDFITAVYDNPVGTRRAILSISRKNGKTALIACILLAHIIGPEAKKNTQIVSGAMSREQASIVFTLASQMVMMSPQLQPLVKVVPSSKILVGLPMNVEYKALAAEGKTAHGLSPVLILIDEAGQIRGPQSDFVDALTTSQGAHENPLIITISTQAATDADLLSIWIDDTKRSKDPRTVCHVYEAPKGCDVLDEAGWRAANPALGLFRSLDDLKEQAEEASRMPSAENTFRNLILNQRVSTITPFISPDVWAQNGREVIPFDDDTPVFCGLDLSARVDLTALIIIGKIDGVWNVVSHFWTPEDGLADRAKRDRAPYDVWSRQGMLHTTPGATVDYEFVAHDMAGILSDYNVQAIGYDRWRMAIMQKELDAIGVELPLIPCGQGFKDMSPAIDALESELLNGRIRHGMHPVLTMCAYNTVVTKDPAGNRKLNKALTSGRIDGMVSLCMAFFAASNSDENETTDLTDYFNQMVS